MGTFLLILALIIAVAAVVFALQNTDPVTVSFFAWQFEDQPLALIMLLALAAGVLIGLLTILPGSVRSKWRSSGQRKKIENLEKSLKETQFQFEQAKLEISALQEKPQMPAVQAESPAPVEPTPPVEPAAPINASLPAETASAEELPPEE